MTKYSFVLLSSQKDEFLGRLQELGVVDIRRSSVPVDEESERILKAIEAESERMKEIEEGRDGRSVELEEGKVLLEKEYAETEPWGDYDRERLALFNPHFYCVSSKSFRQEWKESYAIQTVSENRDYIRFVIIGNNDGFPVKELTAPEHTASELRNLINDREREIAAHTEELEAQRVLLPGMEDNIGRMKAELSRHLAAVTGESAGEGSLVIFTGFAPEENSEELSVAFDSMDTVWLAEPASVSDNPPIKLKNNPFARQFEVLTGMYGMPVYDEFDPTPVLAPFFLLFFAMCMGDAGYGILLVIISILLGRKGGELGGMSRLVRFLGIGTIAVGTLLGTFFGISLYSQEWIPVWLKGCMLVEDNVGKIAGYDPQMVLAILTGVFHICLALVIKAVCLTKRFGFKENISTWGWTLLIVGGVATAAVFLAGWLTQDQLKWTVIALGGISALGIFIFNKPGRNPLINIGAGLWDTYSMATGVIGDVLSYIRLYALGLAGGMLGGAFNELAGMTLGSAPTWQWIPFIVVIVLGHALNLAMSCLGAFVHPLRLTFVEYFKNSGYEGQGVRYEPLTNNNQNQ